MKHLFLSFIILLTASLQFTSCTVEKRVHQNGYYLSWNHRISTLGKNLKGQLAEKAERNSSSTDITYPSKKEEQQQTIEQLVKDSKEGNYTEKAMQQAFILSKKDTITPTSIQAKENTSCELNNRAVPATPTNEEPEGVLAIISLIAGVISVLSPVWGLMITVAQGGLLLFIVPFIFFSLIAIVAGVAYLTAHKGDKEYNKFKPKAKTGVILAAIPIAAALFITMLIFAFIGIL